MATVRGRPRRVLFTHHHSLWFKLSFCLVLPIACIIVAPSIVCRNLGDFVDRVRYIALEGTDDALHRAADSRAPITYRWFGRSIPIVDLASRFSSSLLLPAWRELESKTKPGDQIWPFTINPRTPAMRQGFVVVRRRKPVGLIVTVVS